MSHSSFEFRIRPAVSREDWQSIRDLCCLTGNAGDPIDVSRWPFFAEQWIGPYQLLFPEWTYIAEAGGQFAGYLTGCPDTSRLNRSRLLRFDLPLVTSVAFGGFNRNGDTRRFVRRLLRLEHGPEHSFTRNIKSEIRAVYPAHLHMNLDSRFRGRGVGQGLIERYFADLRAAGVDGIHLFCGPKPVGFYERAGMHEMARIEFRPGVWVYAMGARFA